MSTRALERTAAAGFQPEAMAIAEGAEKALLRTQYDELFKLVHSEKLGEVATEFDHIHSVHCALKVEHRATLSRPPVCVHF